MKEIMLYDDLIEKAKEDGWKLFRMLDLAGKMPFDLIGWLDGEDFPGGYAVPVGIEVKMERRVGGLVSSAPMPSSWWTNRRHQLGNLRELANAGGLALIMVYRCDRKAGGWTMLRLRPGLSGDLRMLPVDAFDQVDIAADLSNWGELLLC